MGQLLINSLVICSLALVGATGCGTEWLAHDGNGDCMGTDCATEDASGEVSNTTEPSNSGCGGADGDNDGVCDEDDGCPSDPAKSTPGDCGCSVADNDGDGDGIADCDDECVNDPRKFAAGACGCGTAETDSDGDGIADCVDECPSDPTNSCTEPITPEGDSDEDEPSNCCNCCCPCCAPTKTPVGMCE